MALTVAAPIGRGSSGSSPACLLPGSTLLFSWNSLRTGPGRHSGVKSPNTDLTEVTSLRGG